MRGMNTAYAEREPARSEVDALPGATLLEFGTPWCGC
jgi:thioredoxin 1